MLVLEIEGGRRAKDQAVGGPHNVEKTGLHRRAELPQAFMTDRMFFDPDIQIEPRRCRLQDLQRRGRDLRTDAVTPENNDTHDNSQNPSRFR